MYIQQKHSLISYLYISCAFHHIAMTWLLWQNSRMSNINCVLPTGSTRNHRTTHIRPIAIASTIIACFRSVGPRIESSFAGSIQPALFAFTLENFSYIEFRNSVFTRQSWIIARVLRLYIVAWTLVPQEFEDKHRERITEFVCLLYICSYGERGCVWMHFLNDLLIICSAVDVFKNNIQLLCGCARCF